MRWLVLLLFATPAMAQNSSLSLQLPNPPMNYQSDSFRAGNLECSNAIGGGTNLEFGVFGGINEDMFGFRTNDTGVYARIVIPLDGPKTRIDCSRLFELELQYRQMEVLRLQTELLRLKGLQQYTSPSVTEESNTPDVPTFNFSFEF